ncbi:MAG: hypothetical protein ABI743_02435 [bacterium]
MTVRTTCVVSLVLACLVCGCPQKSGKTTGSAPATPVPSTTTTPKSDAATPGATGDPALPSSTATFTPYTPIFEADTAVIPESEPERVARLYWNALPHLPRTTLPQDKNTTVPLVGWAYGISPEEVEAQLPKGWTAMEYITPEQDAFKKEGIIFRHYRCTTPWTTEEVPTSPPGAGGKAHASPRFSCYFLNNALVGVDMDLSDLAITDQELVDQLTKAMGDPGQNSNQNADANAKRYLKIVSLIWEFGFTNRVMNSVELSVFYTGTAPGSPVELLLGSDRLYGRILRVANTQLGEIERRLWQERKTGVQQ